MLEMHNSYSHAISRTSCHSKLLNHLNHQIRPLPHNPSPSERPPISKSRDHVRQYPCHPRVLPANTTTTSYSILAQYYRRSLHHAHFPLLTVFPYRSTFDRIVGIHSFTAFEDIRIPCHLTCLQLKREGIQEPARGTG